MDEVLDEFLAAADEFNAAAAAVESAGLPRGPGWDRHDRASARLARVWGRRTELAAAVRRLRADLAAERERCARVCEETDAVGDYRTGPDGDSAWASDAEASLREAARRIRMG